MPVFTYTGTKSSREIRRLVAERAAAQDQRSGPSAGVMNSFTARDTALLREVGTGFSESMRQEIWEHQSMYLGRLARYKHQPGGANGTRELSTGRRTDQARRSARD